MYNDEKVLKSVDEYLRQLKRKKKIQTTVFLSFLVIILISVFLLYSPFLNIKDIKVFGLTRYEQQYIIDLSGISIGQNLLKLNDKEIIDSVQSDSYIEKAELVKEWPDKIKIVISERKPMCCIFSNGQYLLLDKDGRILENVSNIVKNCPEIKGSEVLLGYDFSNIKNTIVQVENKKVLDVALQILELADNSTFYQNGEEKKNISKIDYIDVSDMDNIMLSINNKHDVNFGKASELKSETILYRFQFLDTIEKDLEGTEAIINMSESLISNKKTYVIEKG